MTNTGASSELVAGFLARTHKLLIGGEWLEAASGETLETIDPATGHRLGQVAVGGATDIDLAVGAARRALEANTWREMPPSARAKLMWKLAELLEANVEQLALLESLDNGMPLRMAKFGSVISAAETLRYNAGWIGKITGETPTLAAPEHHAYTVREPVGVVGLIVPWNFPLAIAVAKIAPAIAAGCTVVLKPAEQTPLTALRLGELVLEAGFPPGVINIVTGYGINAGQALVDHPGVDKISFTGSAQVGKSIAVSTAASLKRVTLELGGKSAVIIFPDAHLGAAALGAAMGVFLNAAQVCVAGARVFIHKSVFDVVVSGIAARARAFKVGSGQLAETEIGPLISQAQLEGTQAYIESGRRQGGTLVTGGRRIGQRGYFVEPTVMIDRHPDMTMISREIFGPVLVAMPFEHGDLEALAAYANAPPYGLSASIWTRDITTAHMLARKIKAGIVCINGGVGLDPNLPFCGYKQSGWGRENGRMGIEAYTELKAVTVALR